MRFKYLLFLLVIGFASCDREKLPEGVLNRGKMVGIIVDIHLSDALFSHRFVVGMDRDSLQDDLFLSVCRKHNVDPEVVDKSLYYYARHPEKFRKIYDEAVDRLNEMEIEIKKDSLPDAIPPVTGDTIRTEVQPDPADSVTIGIPADSLK